MIVYRVVSDTSSASKMRERCRTLSSRIAGRHIQWIGTMDDRVWDMEEVERVDEHRILMEREVISRSDRIGMLARRTHCDGVEVSKIITVDWQRRPKEYIIAIYEGYAFHVAHRRYLLSPDNYGREPEDV